jgi:hypothetical protein
MLGLDLDFTCSIKDYWVRITFIAWDYDPMEWGMSFKLLGINFDHDDDELKPTEKQFNLFYYHNSVYLKQLDILGFNIFTNFKN